MATFKTFTSAFAFVLALSATTVTQGEEQSQTTARAAIPAFRPSDCAYRACVLVGSGPSCDTYYSTKTETAEQIVCFGAADDGYEEQ